MKTIFAKYNNERLPRYQIVTKIIKDEHDNKYAIKEPLHNESNNHIENIYNNYELLKSIYDINLVKPEKVNNCILFEVVDGKLLENILCDAIYSNDVLKFQKYMNKFLYFVDSMVYKRDTLFNPSKEFINIFGEWNITEPQDIIKVANIDLIFGNIFVDKNDQFILIDYEWVFDFEVPKSYIIWRSLAIFSAYHSINLDSFITMPIKINNDFFLIMDNNFSNLIYGKKRKYFLSSKVSKVTNSMNLEEKETSLSSNYFIQLFIEDENPISEENSIKFPVVESKQIQIFRFDLSSKQNLKNLRLDPVNDCCIIEIENISLIKADGQEFDLIPYIQAEGYICHGKSYVFDSEDPQIYFDYINVQELKEIKSVVVSINYKYIGQNALRVSAKQIKLDLDNTKIELDSTKTELDSTKTELDSTKTELDSTKTELINIRNTLSWKMTKPIRFLKKLIKG